VARFAEPRHVNIPCHGRKGVASLALEQTQPGGLANDSGLGGLIVIKTRVAGGGVIAAGDASGGNAAIRVRGEDSTALSTVRSLKSRRFLVPLGHVVPWVQITPSCTDRWAWHPQ